MCGVFTLCEKKTECAQKTGCSSLRNIALPSFHLGRLTSYTILSIASYYLLQYGFPWSPLRQALIIVMLTLASLIYVTHLFPCLSVLFPFIGSLALPIPARFKNAIMNFVQKNNIAFVRGFLLGFMPCGLLFAALLATASAPSLMINLISIFAFFLGTLPVIFGLRFTGQAIQTRYQAFKPLQAPRIQIVFLSLNVALIVFVLLQAIDNYQG
jgi:uncharacterized protein